MNAMSMSKCKQVTNVKLDSDGNISVQVDVSMLKSLQFLVKQKFLVLLNVSSVSIFFLWLFMQVLHSDAGEDAEAHAAKLLEVILLQYKGLVDQVKFETFLHKSHGSLSLKVILLIIVSYSGQSNIIMNILRR